MIRIRIKFRIRIKIRIRTNWHFSIRAGSSTPGGSQLTLVQRAEHLKMITKMKVMLMRMRMKMKRMMMMRMKVKRMMMMLTLVQRAENLKIITRIKNMLMMMMIRILMMMMIMTRRRELPRCCQVNLRQEDFDIIQQKRYKTVSWCKNEFLIWICSILHIRPGYFMIYCVMILHWQIFSIQRKPYILTFLATAPISWILCASYSQYLQCCATLH